ncbi:MAG: RNA methyltransferase [Alphaproteobacteria bacterium]|nr:RNA methyltransferase [Alphaproteobacteria bacterium]
MSAVAAVFERRPEDVERLFLDARLAEAAGPFCARMTEMRRPFRIVASDELAKVAGTALNGGIVAMVPPPSVPPVTQAEIRDWARAGKPLVALDGVSNPHNLGAIARSMSFFGLDALILSGHPAQANPSEAAWRVAEGGLDWLALRHAHAMPQALQKLRQAGFRVVATMLGRGRPIEEIPTDKPLVLVMGNEEEGLSPATLAACDEIVTVSGSGRVQSLNVASTAAILIHHAARTRK